MLYSSYNVQCKYIKTCSMMLRWITLVRDWLRVHQIGQLKYLKCQRTNRHWLQHWLGIYIMIVSLMWLLNLLCSHEGPVWQVAWAHPKYGSILASCSYDRKVQVNISIRAVTHALHQRLSSGRKPVERGSSCTSFVSTNHQVKAQD